MKKILFCLFLGTISTALSAQDGFDETFGNNGTVLTDFGGTFTGRKVLRQSDGKLLMTGWFMNTNTSYDKKFLATRFDADGAIDSTFGDAGILKSEFESSAAALLANDYILVTSRSGSVSQFQPDGALDSTFGNNGMVNLYLNEFWIAWVSTIEVQADGKILLAGGVNSEYPEFSEFSIASIHSSGIPDSTFGTNGVVVCDSTNFLMRVNDLVIQPDGKILAASTLFGSVPVVVRLYADGSLDESFGNGGVALAVNGGNSYEGISVLLQSDDKILLASSDGSLSRFSSDGILDSTFGNSGVVQITGYFEINEPIALQEDGKILAGFEENDDFAIGRWMPDGNLDTTFGIDGIQQVDIWGYDGCSSLLILPDGKIIAGGHSDGQLSLTRLMPEGEVDLDFGKNGAISMYLGGFRAEPRGIGTQSNGKLVAGGWASSGDIILVRYLDDGSPDPSFGTNGKVITNWKDYFFSAGDMAIQPDDKIVIAGTLENHYFLFRYQPDGAPDNEFGENGLLIIEDGAPYTDAYSLAIQADGKYVLAGRMNKSLSLVRCMAEGMVDTSFGNGGWIVHPDIAIEPYENKPRVVLQADGKILLGSPQASDGFNLFRYLPDGAPDLSFNFLGKAISGVSQLSAILVQPDGKIIVGGCNDDDTPDPKIARLLPNGAIDPGFQFTSNFEQTLNWQFGIITDMILQPNGKITFTGFRDDENLYPGGIICGRINPNGSIDSSFFHWGHMAFRVGYDCYAYDMAIQLDGKVLVAGTSESDDDYWYSIAVGSDFLLARIPQDPAVGVSEPVSGIEFLTLSPNPLQSHAFLSYELEQAEILSIFLYDVSGKWICTLLNREKRPAGSNLETLAIPEELPGGTYYLTLRTGKGQSSVMFVK